MTSGSPDEAGEDDISEDDAGVDSTGDDVRVWLVERTYSDDEQNLIILTYATPDGRRSYRKERALTTYGDDRETQISVVVDPDDLGSVDDPETIEWYADEAASVAEEYGEEGTL